MQLYASVGRRAEAVRQFAICTDSLRSKLGVAPDAQTIALARAIQAEGPAQAMAAGGGAAEHVPAAEPADAEIPAPAAAACDHVHDVASEAAANDLRRTCRSLMSRRETGISRDVAERVLGHKIGGQIEQVYDRHSYKEEKADALAALAALIERILSPSPADENKVVELAQHRG
jgi:hypothetical protein